MKGKEILKAVDDAWYISISVHCDN